MPFCTILPMCTVDHDTVCPHYKVVFGVHDIEQVCKLCVLYSTYCNVRHQGNYLPMSMLHHECTSGATSSFVSVAVRLFPSSR